MSLNAPASTEPLRPQHVAPVELAGLAQRFNLRSNSGSGSGAITVTGVAQGSAEVSAGDLFVALPGTRVHGAEYAPQALAAGAVAILTDDAGAALLTEQGIAVPVLISQELQSVVGPLAAMVYGQPADHLVTAAVTGTNGKTTTATMVDHVLRALGRITGLIGTVEVSLAGKRRPAVLTTPQPADLQRFLACLREAGGTDLVMEASSHALAMHRTEPLVFTVAGFTNLTQDHLDYHSTMDEYFEAKALLFTPQHSQHQVVCVDDVWGRRLAERLSASPEAQLLTLRTPLADAAGQAYQAHWSIQDIQHRSDRTDFTLVGPAGARLETSTSLPGDFNVANAALAVLMVHATGVSLEQIGQALGAAGVSPVVPGRVEVVGDASKGPRVLVDFAHNPGALEAVLSSLRPTVQGRLILVFGATGNRDTGKRPQMTKIAMQGADVVILTDDDPHNEDPAAIRAELMAVAVPATPPGTLLEEVAPREAAIRRAIELADPQDTVLVAGRGHETIQDVAGEDISLDDRVVAAEALRHKEGSLA
ncbi:UDP-N-acetylmuramoyl-L-alanyl-D-glutamate--2,6-diaminopimelate ligase [Actinomyces bovis]|uniref:UDP-N-acetylmuramyl-tripeptide synthetase n=1 Tax=Actinomyces bovis TaxID=1658 RepID=A0ABY1VQH6_9ACTO|nr:UDP-N-acetylmuramoyl-L-alanyl-D-glutamate--2,6-diaminopimelate ligase [Actinomyces bovis]SPT53927.1 UDP-N-acetylmuramoyl-L-alanyl-D-glutamate--2,6-diaminopimelate ligase [Actinomyces bovis]VEG53418.1 UDP-N-acetylmuramoyl-L-alanyl-D-glutamate--2,6-diaminopimelate ligase [Actinomyces israelii]